MTPIAFDGCTGWLHRRHDAETGSIAILLCPALNHDALNSHHAMRLLADQMAEAGYPTMRFDYPSTGDSVDLDTLHKEHGSELSEIWVNSIILAADFLLRVTGARKLIFCGLRIGATLAAMAAQGRNDIVGFVFLAPVLKGQSYLRQIWIESKLQNEASDSMQNGITFQELSFNAATVRAMGRFDLRQWIAPSSADIAIFSQTENNLLNECCRNWSESGARASCFNFEGLEPMLSLNIEDEKPTPRFNSILDWLRENLPPSAASTVGFDESIRSSQISQTYIETPVFFGGEKQLFGVVCEGNPVSTEHIVLIVNPGRDPRHAPGRFSVEFARLLAKDGISSFRFDFAGLGDSPGPAGKETELSPVFDLDRSADISAAIDMVEKTGYRHIFVYGLCSGAYHALRAALAEPRITGLLLVNLPFFDWNGGERAVDFIRHKNKTPQYFIRELFKLRSWKDARHKLGKFESVLRGQLHRLATLIKTASWLPTTWRDLLAGGTLTIGQRNITTLSQRGVQTLFLFGQDDLGLDAFKQEFGGDLAGFADREGVTFTVLSDFDHLVANKVSRCKAAQAMIGFLTKQKIRSHPRSC